ncbi:MAG: NAD-dependent malic enzyme [Acetobacter fabarum]|jgi:malate dehydrogenase (oxaloacetate-decarboxylating)(NADP+)|uniref:NAD-dependent malic enzyme n=1 Tax=Acetobacter fabarum TaxID=483199 RepID=UPI0024305468|nr:NAD-dependent malic enzyme [Acetobacter fabarum]MCH4025525.1 NAD-dependent malic enzyme [Acetobacter fabarum]MCH4086615.1 NAD-dependent malic enzyme [Acetobacter fabarum]MCH4128128.1 NAD-dependent malic enzyme [Acetobacter fabarum]MCH4138489.1 NAD-dependent malic enzyme [Acetobacter fabarum]MCH4141340.1 NAD-dependent malic enzyme [Acetobacter fabarum]
MPSALPLRGTALLNNALLNKGTAFTEAERREYGLEGLLPTQVETLDRQVERIHRHLEAKPSNLERYIYLSGLRDQNQTLFYRVLMSNPAQFVPIVYAPTLAAVCQQFSHIYRRPRGMYISLDMRGRIRDVLRNWPTENVRFLCVTTGGRILGLGDIGVNGMGIPIGKLDLYTACGAVPPEVLLPVQLDIGTTNSALRADPLYLGLRREPPPLEELDGFVEEFVSAVKEVFPNCCLHFEDWKGTDALHYLDKYRNTALCYNDDIQGTAAVTLAGLITALKIKNETLAQQRFLFLGAGSSGLGTADMLISALKQEGISEQEAIERITLMDVNGLLETSRTDLSPQQKRYAKAMPPSRDLLATIKAIKPTVLIGVSTSGGAFTQEVVETMSALNERPIIFPLSLPQKNAECTAEQAYEWSQGQALFAAGLQFPEVEMNGRTFYPGQANNFYIFPALGLAVYATCPKHITDDMVIETARALADQVDPASRERGRLFPPQSDILEVSVTSAARIAEFIFDQGAATVERPKDIRAWIESLTYSPRYAD